ncbi:hypothetical protein SAMN04488061_3647 [Filomicrobium insigne]|uniref:Uncharacterized protein n=1 Tax=Filomicrobium insigne TaxID=418854 RepID=A0A1H0UJD2_9HYPH|nr:hypothetical protein [Filomicrobium insigne]SDP65966.1 hypothetical protein SAMN04488061_3647 [Filomicrobium insigne]
MGEDISERARALFEQARSEAASGFQKIMREHASKGQLNSGATVIRFVRMHETTTREALGSALESIGRRVESRGFRWRQMIEGVCRELDTHIADAEQALKGELEHSVKDGPRLAEPSLAEARERLCRQVEDYREGWTGTPGKPWSERNKVLYTVLAALGGAALAELGREAVPAIAGIASKLVGAVINGG